MKEITLNVINKTKGKLPRLPFVDMKETILGKTYDLSIAFVTKKKSRELNARYRGKDKPTNILSFSLSKKSGEIIIHLPTVRRDAINFGKTFDTFLGFLVIHGMLHLKGYEHGGIMERAEEKFSKKFNF